MDKLLLQTLSSRNRYKALFKSVPLETVGTSTAWLLKSYGAFFDKHPKAQDVDFEILKTMVRLKMDNEEAAQPALKLIDVASKAKATPDQIEDVTQQLHERGYAGRLAMLVNRYNDGEEIDLSHETYKETMSVRKLLGNAAESMFEQPDIHEILAEAARDVGIKFRQTCLQESIKGLLPPLSIAFCSGVDSGKTSMLCDAMTFFAPQCAKLFPGRPIIWFSNEGTVREIWPRLYSSALGLTGEELAKLSKKELYDKYEAAVGGNRQIIKLKDAHGWTMAQVAGVIEELAPCIVVFDMLANFKMPGVEKRHEKMEALFQEVREMAALHDFIAFSTVQLSADGLNQLYPPMNALKDSKIGLQGALDIQIMMGRLDDPAYAMLRGFSTPKNKRKVVGKPGNVRAEVMFDPDRARFKDS